MMTTANDRLVADYLDRLRAATADLPRGESDELVASIAEHIATSLAELTDPGEAEVRTTLERLGDPADIAAEARGQSGGPVGAGLTAAAAAPAPGALEWGGVVMLGVGSYVLPIIGTVAGLVMVSMSGWWTTRQKVLAAVLSLAGLLVVPLIGIGLFAARAEGGHPRPATPVVNMVPAVPAPTPSST